MANVTRYNAKDCTVMIDDVNVTGLGEDMISWEKDEAYFETSVGAQGDIVKSEINNSLHTLTLTLQPTSPQLKYIMSLRGKSDTFPVWVVNKALGLRIGGTQANIIEMPEISLGAEAEDVEITICVFDGTTELA